jgi:hypothetical protein
MQLPDEAKSDTSTPPCQYRTDSRMQVLDAFETFKREGTHLHSELNVRVSSLLGGFPPVKERGPLPGVLTGWTVCIVTLC